MVQSGLIAMKVYTTFPKAPGLEPHNHKQLSVIPKAHGRESYSGAKMQTCVCVLFKKKKTIFYWKIIFNRTSSDPIGK